VPARILIVDDDIEQRTNVAQMVTSMGYCADTASDGEQALEKLGMAKPTRWSPIS